ncbi:MAG: hypothetical protein AAF621_06480, partial [Pseudomonadota bacterium]
HQRLRGGARNYARRPVGRSTKSTYSLIATKFLWNFEGPFRIEVRQRREQERVFLNSVDKFVMNDYYLNHDL